MSPSSSPASKRPWYLFAALVAGWVYGARALSDGWETVSYYRDERPDVHALTESINDTNARESVIAAGERWLTVRDAAKTRELPIGVASLLLGGAMILFSARSMAAREGARQALLQVVLVHAGLVIGGFFLTTDVTRGRVEFEQRFSEAIVRSSPTPQPPGTEATMRVLMRALPSIETIFQTVASGLIVLALTRPRARAFFRAAPEPFEG